MPSANPTSSQTQDGARAPKIIYATRTHSQLSQVIRELKSTAYKPRSTVLGSRQQMCIHKTIKTMKGNAQNVACRNAVNVGQCAYYQPAKNYAKEFGMGEAVADIEDVVGMAEKAGVCPYYLTRESQTEAELVFMPYNYIVDSTIRQTLTLNLQNSVVIFDEAHNLEEVCSSASSFEITTIQLADCIKEVEAFLAILDRGTFSGEGDPNKARELQGFISRLLEYVVKKPMDPRDGATMPGASIYDMFEACGVSYNSKDEMLELIDTIAAAIQESAMGAVKTGALSIFQHALKVIFREGITKDQMSQYYRVHLSKLDPPMKKRTSLPQQNTLFDDTRKLSFWCFHAGLAMYDLMKCGVKTVLLTSGTLSPLDSFAAELSLAFPIRLENPHVIEDWQVRACVIKSGPDGTALDSSYKNRDNKLYLNALGLTIVNVVQKVPDGVLVFFPSYSVMTTCLNAWKIPGNDPAKNTVWDSICRYKQPVLEPRQTEQLGLAMQDFYAKVDDPHGTGAIFFAVCRGKVSEGLDFADKYGRAVIITGLPYPNVKDPHVSLKRQYLDDRVALKNRGQLHSVFPGDGTLNGNDWYQQSAHRAVNQAVGRVIRHRDDYGMILLADGRFANPQAQKQLSYWLRKHSVVHDKFGLTVQTLVKFFKDVQIQSVQKIQKRQKSAEIVQQLDESKNPNRSDGDGGYDVAERLRQLNEDERKKKEEREREEMEKEKEKKRVGVAIPTVVLNAKKTSPGNIPAAFNPPKKKPFDPSALPDPRLLNKNEEMYVLPEEKEEAPGGGGYAGGYSGLLSAAMMNAKRVQATNIDLTLSPLPPHATNKPVASTFSSLFAPASALLNSDQNPKIATSASGKFGLQSAATALKLQKMSEAEKTALSKNYLTRVKEILAPSEFARFKALLQAYKVDRNVPRLFEEMFSLVGAEPRKHSLLDGFSEFVPKQHVESYRKKVDAFLRDFDKRVEEKEEKEEKGGKGLQAPIAPQASSVVISLDTPPMEKTVSKLNPISLDTPPLVNAVTSPKKERNFDMSLDASLPSQGAGSLKRKMTFDLFAGEFITKKPRLEEEREMKRGGAEDDKANEGEEGEGGERGEEEAPQSEEQLKEKILNNHQDGQCPICQQNSFKAPHAAKCGHVCCYLCWKGWLATKLECPLCKEKTRLKTLRPSYLL